MGYKWNFGNMEVGNWKLDCFSYLRTCGRCVKPINTRTWRCIDALTSWPRGYCLEAIRPIYVHEGIMPVFYDQIYNLVDPNFIICEHAPRVRNRNFRKEYIASVGIPGGHLEWYSRKQHASCYRNNMQWTTVLCN